MKKKEKTVKIDCKLVTETEIFPITVLETKRIISNIRVYVLQNFSNIPDKNCKKITKFGFSLRRKDIFEKKCYKVGGK